VAGKGGASIGRNLHEDFLSQEILQAHSDHAIRLEAVPFAVGGISKLATQIPVPVTDECWNAIGYGLKPVIRRAEIALGLERSFYFGL
jgi:hypothetical protein